MTPGQALKELVTLANRPQGIVWRQLQPHHRQQVGVAIKQRLISDGAMGYLATADGRRFIAPAEPEAVPGKTCPACNQDKAADEFWADPNRSDSLFFYCISCESNRRKEVRRMKREHQQAINVAATLAQQAARNWDEATILLAKAWQEMVAADTTIRRHEQLVQQNATGGRLTCASCIRLALTP
jgi:hypothetical protein